MKFHGVDMVGYYNAEEVSELPSPASSYERRVVYLTTDNTLYYSNGTIWVTIVDSEQFDITTAHAQVHAIGGADHNASTLAELNAKISGVNLDATGTPRPPTAHNIDNLSFHPNAGDSSTRNVGTGSGQVAHGDHAHGSIGSGGGVGSTANIPLITGTGGVIQASSFSGINGDHGTTNNFARGNHTHSGLTSAAHDIGGTQHNASTLAELNAKISGVNLDATGTPRPPTAHVINGSAHTGVLSLSQIPTGVASTQVSRGDHTHVNLWYVHQTTVSYTIPSTGLTSGDRFYYVVVAGAGLTISLPSAPMLGSKVAICVGDVTNTIISRNGNRLLGLWEDMIIDVPNVTVVLVFARMTTSPGDEWRFG